MAPISFNIKAASEALHFRLMVCFYRSRCLDFTYVFQFADFFPFLLFIYFFSLTSELFMYSLIHFYMPFSQVSKFILQDPKLAACLLFGTAYSVKKNTGSAQEDVQEVMF